MRERGSARGLNTSALRIVNSQLSIMQGVCNGRERRTDNTASIDGNAG